MDREEGLAIARSWCHHRVLWGPPPFASPARRPAWPRDLGESTALSPATSVRGQAAGTASWLDLLGASVFSFGRTSMFVQQRFMLRVSWWSSGLMIRHSHCCGGGLNPGPGTPTWHRCSQKKVKLKGHAPYKHRRRGKVQRRKQKAPSPAGPRLRRGMGVPLACVGPGGPPSPRFRRGHGMGLRGRRQEEGQLAETPRLHGSSWAVSRWGGGGEGTGTAPSSRCAALEAGGRGCPH